MGNRVGKLALRLKPRPSRTATLPPRWTGRGDLSLSVPFNRSKGRKRMGGKTWRYKHHLLMRKLRRKHKLKKLAAKKRT